MCVVCVCVCSVCVCVYTLVYYHTGSDVKQACEKIQKIFIQPKHTHSKVHQMEKVETARASSCCRLVRQCGIMVLTSYSSASFTKLCINS